MFNAGAYSCGLPKCIAFDTNGEVFIATGTGHSVIVCRADNGEFIRRFGARGIGKGEFSLTHGVAVDSNRGLVFVSEPWGYRCQALTRWQICADVWLEGRR